MSKRPKKQPTKECHSASKTHHNKSNKIGNKHSNKSSNKHSNRVRIIGGEFKSRQIDFANANGLRPTPDRLRETLFNWLMGYVNDANVLDVCAGSGILGFEALSRGARQVTFIEPNPIQIRYLQKAIIQLELDSHQATLINTTAEQALLSINRPAFDLVFLDPPYALNLWQPLLGLLIEKNCLHPDSLIYLEADRPLEQVLTDTWQHTSRLHVIKHKKVGQIFAYLLNLAE